MSSTLHDVHILSDGRPVMVLVDGNGYTHLRDVLICSKSMLTWRGFLGYKLSNARLRAGYLLSVQLERLRGNR